MPLGVLSDEEFEVELAKLNGNKNSNSNARILPLPPNGRGPKLETPESARKLISELAIEGNDISVIAKEFNISPSSISAYKHGSTSTSSYGSPSEALSEHNKSVRDRIIKKARKKLTSAMDHIDDEKLSDSSAKELAGIAKDMSSVIRNLEPEVKQEGNGNNQIIFFAPQVKEKVDYPIVIDQSSM